MAFAPEHDPANAASTPDYDGLGWDSQWSAQDWMTWYGALVKNYGVGQAQNRFLSAWNNTGSVFEEPPLDARTFDSSFRDFARANGLLDGLYGAGLGVLAKPLGVGNDVLDGLTAVGGGVKDAGKKLGAWLTWILAGLAILALVFYFAPQLARASVTKKKAAAK